MNRVSLRNRREFRDDGDVRKNNSPCCTRDLLMREIEVKNFEGGLGPEYAFIGVYIQHSYVLTIENEYRHQTNCQPSLDDLQD